MQDGHLFLKSEWPELRDGRRPGCTVCRRQKLAEDKQASRWASEVVPQFGPRAPRYTVSMPLARDTKLIALSAGNFFARYHHYLITLIIATFLASFMSEVALGFVIAGASAIVAASLLVMPILFTRSGTKSVLVVLGLAEMIIIIGLSIVQSALPAAILFALQGMCAYNMFLGLDLLLEARTIDEQKTGHFRGIFLVCANASVLVASLSLAFILTDHNYADVFLIAAASLVPFTLLAASLPAISRVPAAPRVTFEHTIHEIIRRGDLLITMSVHFLLLIFFTWILFYVPLYLYGHIGFSWKVIGLFMALSLVPSILFEYPLGSIADTYLGEKEITVTGFILMALGIGALSFITGKGALPWAIAVLVLGIGGAAVEVATESHFFKRVSAMDGEIIGIFRMLRPIAAIVGPTIASLVLLFVPFSMIFVVFGVILLLGIPLTLAITDTK